MEKKVIKGEIKFQIPLTEEQKQAKSIILNNVITVLKGAAGSGKSTLLQLIAASLSSSEGKINYEFGGKKLEAEDVYQYLSLAGPYLELIE